MQFCPCLKNGVTGSEWGGNRKNHLSNTVTQLGYPELIAESTVRISIAEQQCQVAYERIVTGIAQALNSPLIASAARLEEHVL